MADYYDGLRFFDAGNYTGAFNEWQMAADKEDTKSQFRLGILYEKGLGTLQSFVAAHLYYSVASSRGNEEAGQARDLIAKRMTPEELQKAQKLSAKLGLNSVEFIAPAGKSEPKQNFSTDLSNEESQKIQAHTGKDKIEVKEDLDQQEKRMLELQKPNNKDSFDKGDQKKREQQEQLQKQKEMEQEQARIKESLRERKQAEEKYRKQIIRQREKEQEQARVKERFREREEAERVYREQLNKQKEIKQKEARIRERVKENNIPTNTKSGIGLDSVKKPMDTGKSIIETGTSIKGLIDGLGGLFRGPGGESHVNPSRSPTK